MPESTGALDVPAPPSAAARAPAAEDAFATADAAMRAPAASDAATSAAIVDPTLPPPPASGRERARATMRRLRLPALAFAVGVVVAAAGVVAIDSVRDATARDDVAQTLDAYLATVESGAPASGGLVAALDEAVASTALVAAAVVAAGPAAVDCDEPRLGADVAIVDCSVRVERRSEPARLVLERVGDAWSVTQGLAVPVRLQPGTLLVEEVAGEPVETAITRGERAVWLLPGRYDVAVRSPAQLVVANLDGLVVTASSGSVRWTSDTTPQLDADVEASALAFVRGCAVAPAEGCPALQQRDAADPFQVFAIDGRLRPGDPYALTFEVSIRRPIEQPEEFVVVTVRVDFGEGLDRYEVAAG
ncbi:hypothetical protein GCM10009846_04270 [Agrococcus versicolor]|uniref:DUF4878 domain-containing protein n=2 Tax=Agrococcus versicolor TaxID=501482 RepID=A0ABP5MEX1_9MICO